MNIFSVQVQQNQSKQLKIFKAADGNTIEISEVVPTVQSISQPLSTHSNGTSVTSDSNQLVSVASSLTSPQTTSTGSMMQLLLQMQSQANAALKKGDTSLASTPIGITTSAGLVVTNVTPSGLTLNTSRQKVTKSGFFATTANRMPKALCQYIEVSASPTESKHVAVSQPPITAMAAPAKPILIQPHTSNTAPQLHIIKPASLNPVLKGQGTAVMSRNTSNQPLILPNLGAATMIVSGSSVPAKLPVLSQQISTKPELSSPVKKRHKPKLIGDGLVSPPPDKIQRTVVTVCAPVTQQIFTLPSNVASPTTVVTPGQPVILSNSYSVSSPSGAMSTAITSAMSAHPQELVNVVNSILQSEHGTLSSSSSNTECDIIQTISEGFVDIFSDISTQINDLKQGGPSRETMKMVVERVVTEQIATDVINSNVSWDTILFHIYVSCFLG